MLHQLGDLLGERSLGQLDRLVEPRLHPLAFLLVQFGVELPQIAGRLDRRVFMLDAEEPDQGNRVVARVKQISQAPPSR